MNTLSMARKKKELTPNQQLARAILDQYQPKSVEDMQNALKDIFGPMFEAMLQGEMNSHLGYSNNERGDKETPNRRNGYTKKTLKMILSRLVDTFFSRISLTMPPAPKSHNTAYVLPWEEPLHWQSRSSGYSSS